MVNQDMDVADRADDALINGIDELELDGYATIDDLDEFLAKFTEGTEEEATAFTQGEEDTGGRVLGAHGIPESTPTVH